MLLELRSHRVTVGWRRLPIISDLDLAFGDDRCHCLVGINGVGKTALLMSMTRRNSLIRPDGSWQPAAYFSTRETIAAERQTVMDFAKLYARPLRLEHWGLTRQERQPVQSISQGEKTRLMLSVAESLDPQALLLDEPSLGLDLESQGLLAELIQGRVSRGRTTIVSTHDLTALDTDNCRIIYLHREEGSTSIVEGEGLILNGSADIVMSDREPMRISGSAAGMARTLLEMQTARFR